ncbi:MAG: DNA-directed RNA polymerase subunit omega, partial [Bacteroidia bacterium]|nr:DNA-directed RNA polymerase subunit omega [Bacteroidia bacterium]MCX7652395.1 DNA-directed RNA polymerase subunit omega [Bacteroidia bacterium]
IKDLLLRSPQNNIYEIVFNVSRRAEQILSELTDELRTKLQDISAHEDLTQRGDPETQQYLQAELQQWVELYRSLPKPTLIALREKLNEPPSQA